MKQDDIAALLDALARFDEIFAVLLDEDAAHVKAIVEWARSEGLEEKISPATLEIATSASLTDDQVSALVEKHSAARKARHRIGPAASKATSAPWRIQTAWPSVISVSGRCRTGSPDRPRRR